MSDDQGKRNGDYDESFGGGDFFPLRPDADKDREPEFVTGRMGTRLYSLRALLERIEDQFMAEYPTHSPVLREMKTRTQRLRLLLDVTDYVLSVESIVLSSSEKADLVKKAYSYLFGYSGLDRLIADERITTISLLGADYVSVRYGHGDMTVIKPIFEDKDDLRRVLERLLRDAGAELRDDQPFVETGLTVHDRAIAINLVAPPLSLTYDVDIRLHPKQPPQLQDLIAQGFMTDEAADLLRALVASPYGLMIVGDSEAGKTTLMGALAALLPTDVPLAAVERSGELCLSAAWTRHTAQWQVADFDGRSFGGQIADALAARPACMLLDEVRSDDPEMIAPLLSAHDAPRQWWAFRGVPDHKRLQSALGMLARRSSPADGEQMVYALYDRLPFVLTVARIQGQLKLFSVAEWQANPTSEYCDYVMLMQYRDGMARPTDRTISRTLSV